MVVVVTAPPDDYDDDDGDEYYYDSDACPTPETTTPANECRSVGAVADKPKLLTPQ